MGYVSDLSNIRYAFLVPLICHSYVLYFALRGYQPTLSSPALQTQTALNEKGEIA